MKIYVGMVKGLKNPTRTPLAIIILGVSKVGGITSLFLREEP